jgi:hypothetical protein
VGPGFISGHGVSAAQLPSSLGQAVSAASLSVVIASDYTLPVTISTTAGAPMFARLSDGTTAYTGAKTGQFPTSLGRTTMAGSLSVALASDQAALAVNATVQNATLAVTQSGAWTAAQSGTWTVRNQDGTGNALSSTSGALNVSVQNASIAVTAAQLPATLGQHLSAASMSVVLAADQSAVPVSQSGTWTVSSTQLPASLGQTTMSASLPVTIASNQSALAVSQSGTWNIGTVTTLTGITNTVTVSGATSLTGVDYNAGAAGATTQRVVEAGRTSAWKARYDYTGTPVTNSAYTTLVASTAGACTRIRIFDSSGAALVLATGAAASEVDQMYIPPGGFDSVVELYIPVSTRVSIKSVDTASVATGQLLITALS